jgi:hypothetical protein
MHEIAKRAYEVFRESDTVRLIDTVFDIAKKDDVCEVITYDGITMETSAYNELKLINMEKYSIGTNDVNGYINDIFEELQSEVEQYHKDKAEWIEKYKGKTFDDILNGFKP